MATAAQTKSTADQAADTAKTAANTGADAFKAQADFGRQAFQQSADTGRDMFRKGVDTSVAAFGELNSQSRKNMEAFADSAAIATETAQQLASQAAAYGRKVLEEQVTVAKQLAGAKTMQEAWDIQTGYAKSAMDQYLSEANRWTETMTNATVRAWQPINDRVAAAAAQVNAR
jgi:phasin family protein